MVVGPAVTHMSPCLLIVYIYQAFFYFKGFSHGQTEAGVFGNGIILLTI